MEPLPREIGLGPDEPGTNGKDTTRGILNNRGETLTRLRLRVSQAAEGEVRAGHPWVFADSVQEANREGQTGELAVIYDRRDKFLAIGLYDAASPIRVRIVHRGKPETIDPAWWARRLDESMARRAAVFDHATTGGRLIHGESDGWPGLVLDRYGEVLVMKIYTLAWLTRLAEVTALITSRIKPKTLILRLSRNIQGTAREEFHVNDGQALVGTLPEEPVVFVENGIRLEADVVRGQKTGFFLDQRENRKEVETLAKGKSVLNAFSFSGAFSVYAARGGATAVTDLDISAHALVSARRNFGLNLHVPGVAASRQETVQADTFEWLKEGASRFDLMILDPPSLAKRAAERERAMEAYERLNRLGIERLHRNGILVAGSCSAHVPADDFYHAVRTAARKSGRTFEELKTTRHPADHPATFKEAEYLKMIYLQFTS